MAKKRPQESPPETTATNGTTATEELPQPPTATEPEIPPPETQPNGNKGPVISYSVPVSLDTFVQASVWERKVKLRDNAEFTTHEVSFCKRWKNGDGQWKSLHSFRCSEIYALAHVLRLAEVADVVDDHPPS